MRSALCTSGQSPDRSHSGRSTDQVSTTSWRITYRGILQNGPDPTEWHLSPLIAQRLLSGVGQASTSGPVRLPPKPSTSPLVLSAWSPAGGGFQCTVTTMDGAVPLRLPSHPSPREDSDQNQGVPCSGGHRHNPLLVEETLVPPSRPDAELPTYTNPCVVIRFHTSISVL